jgi:hypothetical protein
MQTKLSEAQVFAQNVCNLAQQMRTLQINVSAAIAQYNGRAYGPLIAAMPTYAVLTDGDQGAEDATPVNANPIKGLNISYNNIVAVWALVQEFNAFMANAAVATSDRLGRLNTSLQY